MYRLGADIQIGAPYRTEPSIFCGVSGPDPNSVFETPPTLVEQLLNLKLAPKGKHNNMGCFLRPHCLDFIMQTSAPYAYWCGKLRRKCSYDRTADFKNNISNEPAVISQKKINNHFCSLFHPKQFSNITLSLQNSNTDIIQMVHLTVSILIKPPGKSLFLSSRRKK